MVGVNLTSSLCSYLMKIKGGETAVFGETFLKHSLKLYHTKQVTVPPLPLSVCLLVTVIMPGETV